MSGLPIARISGIEIRVHLSWVIIMAVITLVIAGQLTTFYPGWPGLLPWIVGTLVAVLFFGSVLVHELVHAVTARRRGIPQSSITLLFFGGASEVQNQATRPGDEAAIAGSGPALSLVLGGVLVGLAEASGALEGTFGEAAGQTTLILGALNVVLGLVNLVPGYPLDGGRILRAALWRATGDERRASRLTATAGRAFGIALIAAGAIVAITSDQVNGLMLGLSGWLLTTASRAMDRRVVVEDLLAGLQVDEVMERDVPSVSPQLTLDTFAGQFLGGATPLQVLPVMRDGTLLGVIGASQLRRLGRKRWPTTRVEELMVSPPDLPTLSPNDGLWPALERLRRSGLDGLPVVDGSTLMGLLTRRAVVGAIQARARTLVPERSAGRRWR